MKPLEVASLTRERLGHTWATTCATGCVIPGHRPRRAQARGGPGGHGGDPRTSGGPGGPLPPV